jgi:hypothetical protein
MYSLHDIEVNGLDLAEVLECEIESRAGEHSTLVILARVTEEEFVFEISDCQDLEVLLREGEGRKILFSGILTDIQITESGQVKTVRIEGKSRSWLMDREKHSRSFQNAKMTFQELAQEILANYKDADLIYAAAGKAVGSLIVQYEETDWEFLQRVLSREGIMITPDCRQPGLKLYAGVPELMESAFPCHILDMEKDMDGYYELKANGREVHASDFTRYTVVSEQLMGIFDPVRIQGNPFVVYACRYSFEDQEMQGTYKLQSAKGLTRPVIYPMHLIGVALNGNVVNVSGTKVQVAMAIDGNSRKRALYWFPYSTLSASSDGSGWYCMPEVGDDVRIYFPSKAESEAIALSAVSNYDAPQSGEDRMSDPDNRYLRTKSGQELALAPGYIYVHILHGFFGLLDPFIQRHLHFCARCIRYIKNNLACIACQKNHSGFILLHIIEIFNKRNRQPSFQQVLRFKLQQQCIEILSSASYPLYHLLQRISNPLPGIILFPQAFSFLLFFPFPLLSDKPCYGQIHFVFHACRLLFPHTVKA